MTEEELQKLRSMMREEIGTAVQASEQRTRLVMREEIGSAVQASEQRTGEKLDRIDGRLERVEIRVARMDGRMDQLAAMQRDLRDEVVQVKKEMVEMKTDQREALSILDEATKAINSTQGDQRTLEIKDDENIHALRRDMQIFQNDFQHTWQRFQNDFQHTLQTFQGNLEMTQGHMQAMQDNMRTLTTGVNKFALDFIEMNRMTNERLTYHENSPIDETHPRPRPQQPGDAA